MLAPEHSASDYLGVLERLLPRGHVWAREAGTIQAAVLGGLAPTWATLDARAAFLPTDAFPASTFELLPEWEATLGLPDPCAGPAPTVAQRVAQVVARLIATGGQSIAYYVAVAAANGYAITIRQFAPSQFGSAFGSRFGGDAWAFTWQVNAPTFTVSNLTFGGAFGTPFAAWGNNVLQCELERLAPAHTVLLFSYG